MTIRDVLNADWSVSRINVTVREKDTTKYIMRYCIGQDVKEGLSEKYMYQAENGGYVYANSGLKTLYLNRIIQHCQLNNVAKSKIGLRGILEKEIPKELIDLEVDVMSPYGLGYSDELHGYRFICYVDAWYGISGENKQIILDELN